MLRAAIFITMVMSAGCHTVIAPKTKGERIQTEIIEVTLLSQGSLIKKINDPRVDKPLWKIQVFLAKEEEYREKVHYKDMETYLEYSPGIEVFECIMAPFMVLATLPVLCIITPLELAYGLITGEDPVLCKRLLVNALNFANPGKNSDHWGFSENTYDKNLSYFDTGNVLYETSSIKRRTTRNPIGGETVTVEFIELDKKATCKTDALGYLEIVLTPEMARISQIDMGLTCKVLHKIDDKTSQCVLEIGQEDLEKIYKYMKFKERK